jgi:hypothetical protein
MDLLNYQRTVFGYHGCDRRVADSVLLGNTTLSESVNTYDWLGSGIYFWEHGPQRALEWAEQQAKRKGSKIKHPAVLGAVIQLGNCFDLLDTKCTELLADSAQRLASLLTHIPKNKPASKNDGDWLRRDRDCFLLNTVIPQVETHFGVDFDSIRGVFQEGEPVFPGVGIKRKSHIQIAVRHQAAIIGYFRPENLEPNTSTFS